MVHFLNPYNKKKNDLHKIPSNVFDEREKKTGGGGDRRFGPRLAQCVIVSSCLAQPFYRQQAVTKAISSQVVLATVDYKHTDIDSDIPVDEHSGTKSTRSFCSRMD